MKRRGAGSSFCACVTLFRRYRGWVVDAPPIFCPGDRRTSNTSQTVSEPLQQMNIVGLEFVELRQRLGNGLEPSAEVEAEGIQGRRRPRRPSKYLPPYAPKPRVRRSDGLRFRVPLASLTWRYASCAMPGRRWGFMSPIPTSRLYANATNPVPPALRYRSHSARWEATECSPSPSVSHGAALKSP
jgi:hypothetical protein